MLTIYLRKEPTTDPLVVQYFRSKDRAKCFDVVYYRDADATDRAGYCGWDSPTKPTRRNRYAMHNCCRYRAVWLPDLVTA